jgi:hypothetical protein
MFQLKLASCMAANSEVSARRSLVRPNGVVVPIVRCDGQESGTRFVSIAISCMYWTHLRPPRRR